MPTINVATGDGVHAFDADGSPDVSLQGRAITGLARAGDEIWAIVERRELWNRNARGWRRVADLAAFPATCLASIDGRILVGTSEAHLFRLDGDELRRNDTFDLVDGRDAWFTPWGGPPDTRSLANWNDDVYVNVHVGGILRSSDGGASWTPTIDVDADVHQVTTAEGLVLAACARGLAVSRDRGATWTMRIGGLAATYCRAVAVCGDGVLVSSSNGPGGGGAAVYRGSLASGPFERLHAGEGWFEGNIDSACLDALPDGSLAAFGTGEGRIYVSGDAGSTWAERASGLPQVRRVLVMP